MTNTTLTPFAELQAIATLFPRCYACGKHVILGSEQEPRAVKVPGKNRIVHKVRCTKDIRQERVA
jgi:hypothetical protein